MTIIKCMIKIMGNEIGWFEEKKYIRWWITLKCIGGGNPCGILKTKGKKNREISHLIFIKMHIISITLGELQLSFGKTAPLNSSIVSQIHCSNSGKLGSGCWIIYKHILDQNINRSILNESWEKIYIHFLLRQIQIRWYRHHHHH